MRLTRKQAIELSIELWEWLAETGNKKGDWPGWENYDVSCTKNCFLCEYDNRRTSPYCFDDYNLCRFCPYYAQFGDCDTGASPYSLWHTDSDINSRKKYAKLFLAQLRTL